MNFFFFFFFGGLLPFYMNTFLNEYIKRQGKGLLAISSREPVFL